jgi:mannose-6-phosphate isomerase-like protein (cupin superfamily)
LTDTRRASIEDKRMDSPKIRRVVTGHDAEGKAIVRIDEVCAHFKEGRPNGYVCNIWTTDTAPADNSGQADAGLREGRFTMIENGSVFRILDFRPGVQKRVHRTDTIDYIVVMSGEIDMELEAGEEVHLKAGDVMVQRGTVHNWINRGTQPCVLAVILVHAEPVRAGGRTLEAFG